MSPEGFVVALGVTHVVFFCVGALCVAVPAGAVVRQLARRVRVLEAARERDGIPQLKLKAAEVMAEQRLLGEAVKSGRFARDVLLHEFLKAHEEVSGGPETE